MAQNVMVQVLGGSKKVVENMETVGDVRAHLNVASHFKAAVNGEPVGDDYLLDEGNYVSFAEAVKGA